MERIAPADASCLIYLAKVDGFEALVPIVGKLLAPPGVWFEAVEEGERIGASDVSRIHKATELRLVERVELKGSEVIEADRLRALGLGRGECEALAIAGRTGIVLIDEGRGSRVARDLGFEPISVLQLPLIAVENGRIKTQEAVELVRRLAEVMNLRADVLIAIERRLNRWHQNAANN